MSHKTVGTTRIILALPLLVVWFSPTIHESFEKYSYLNQQADEMGTQAVVGGVNSGIAINYALNVAYGVPPDSAYPEFLDDAPPYTQASAENVFFIHVISPEGISDSEWSKGSTPNIYIAPNGRIYEYNPITGDFGESQ